MAKNKKDKKQSGEEKGEYEENSVDMLFEKVDDVCDMFMELASSGAFEEEGFSKLDIASVVLLKIVTSVADDQYSALGLYQDSMLAWREGFIQGDICECEECHEHLVFAPKTLPEKKGH